MRYIFILIILGIGLWLSACSFPATPEAQRDIEFSPPLVEKEWATQTYFDPSSSQRFCVVTSGRNGLKVILRQDNPQAPVIHSIKSTRSMRPGLVFTVRVNDHVYRNREEFFPQDMAENILEDIKAAPKTYLEWREGNASDNRGGQMLFTTILDNRAFQSRYNECLKAFK